MQQKDAVPVTILTGFLGAGKTTLLNHLVSQSHGYKCAIIINEFGAISIDNQLVVGVDEEILELNNGCLCCRVRGDLIKSLHDLQNKKKRFDYVVIETTGLASPSPIAYTFRSSDLAENFRLDGIVTVVDAKHLDKELGDSPETAAQIAFADVLLLNKIDLVSSVDLDKISDRLRRINPLVRIHRTQNAEVQVEHILNIRARELTAPLSFPEQDHEDHRRDEQSSTHHHEEEGGEHHPHAHDEDVASFYLVEERPVELKKVEAWLTEVIRTMGASIYRSKGILHIKGQGKRVIFQGVQMMFEATPDRFWHPGEKRLNQIVFIGKDLDEEQICRGFEACIAS